MMSFHFFDKDIEKIAAGEKQNAAVADNFLEETFKRTVL